MWGIRLMSRVLLLLFVLLPLVLLACGDQMASTPAPTTVADAPDVTGSRETPEREDKPEVPPLSAATAERAEESVDGDATWTILVYARAGAAGAKSVLARFNQMEAVGLSEGIQVVLQVDGYENTDGQADTGTSARRYLLAAAESRGEIGSALIRELGPVDAGAPQSLAEFVAWGIEAYPAQHIALWLWSPSESISAPEADMLSLAALRDGLEAALEENRQLEIIALDSNQLADVALLAAMQPYAHVAVVAAGLSPDGGLDYGSLLTDMAAERPAGGAVLAATMVRHLPRDKYGPFTSVVAVDLEAVPPLLAALDRLGTALQADPALATGPVSAARSGAQLVGVGALMAMDRVIAVDLGPFSALLAQLSPDLAAAAAAARLQEAVAQAVLPAGDERAHPSGGISLHFPLSPADNESGYQEFLPANWIAFQRAYTEVGLTDVPAPMLSLLQVAGASGGVLQPVFMGFELSGYNISDVWEVAWRLEEGGARLVAADLVLPELQHRPDGHSFYQWRDGVHEDFTIWDTHAPYLSDGEAGEFVILLPTAPRGELVSVPGELRAAGGSSPQKAFLLFDASSSAPIGAWSQGAEHAGRVPHQLAPAPDDLFTPYVYRRAANGNLTAQTGAAIRYGEAGPAYSLQPLPVGEYQLGFEAVAVGGATTAIYADIAVNNDGYDDNVRAYLDPYDGFQFLIPGDWQRPQYNASDLTAVSPDGETRVTLTSLPAAGRRSSELKAQALALFGPVDLLYQDTRTLADSEAERVVYGYDAEGGPRTGAFLVFFHEDRGYVVDVDGPASAEAETLAHLERIAASWLWRPLGFGRVEGMWQSVELASFTVPVPENYSHHTLDNGWELFSHEGRFVALRRDPATGQSRAVRVQHWLDVANAGVSGFEQSTPYSFALAERNWVRADFSYERDGRAIRGLVMVAAGDGVESAAWAEAPAEQYDELLDGVFLALVAEALGASEGEQLLYHADFDTAGTWGLGIEEGALGEVTGGVYRLAVAAEAGFFWTSAGESFGDAIYEVTASQLGGPLDNGYGLLLRADTETASFYVFAVSGDGYVWIGRCDGGCTSMATLAGEGWFAHPAVRQGGEVANKLQVVADGEQLRFLVNDELAGEVTDGRLARGDVGLFVETLGQGDVIVAFDDVYVYAR